MPKFTQNNLENGKIYPQSHFRQNILFRHKVHIYEVNGFAYLWRGKSFKQIGST